MGKVKTVLVKRAGEKLSKQSPEKFSEDFTKNKESLKELGLSKRLRNQIAGYVSNIRRIARESANRVETPIVDDFEETEEN